jgi:integrase
MRDTNRLTVANLCSRWLDAVRHRVGAKTYARYDAIVRLHIVPTLGGMRAETLRPAHIESTLAGSFSGGRKDRKKKQHLSQRSVRHILDTLRAICRWGLKTSILVRNPVDAVEPPKVDRKEMRALDPAGVAQLLDIVRGTALEAPVVVAVGSGLRRGELLGLRWSDVDLGAARLTVRRSVETIGGVTRTKPPKTARSAWTISLPAFVVEALRRLRTQQSEQRIPLGLGRDDEGWVFTREDASAWEPGAFSLQFARLVKRYHIPHVRFHDLRHSFGTLALASGVDLKTVSAALGHSTISMTANTYVHAIEALQRDSAARIDVLLGAVVDKAIGPGRSIPVPQRCHTRKPPAGKPRYDGLFVVAPTGVEPVSPP